MMNAIQDPERYARFVQTAAAHKRLGLVPAAPTEPEERAVALEAPVARRSVTPARRPKVVDATPERSLAQRMDALQRANVIRTRRAQLKRDVKAGRVSVLDVLLEPPEWVETMKAFELLMAVPKYGRVKVGKLLGQVRVSPSKTIGGLSTRQRTELVSMVRR